MCKIVIADDEYLERDVLKHIISGIDGARLVGEGHSGRAAVELCEAMKPDLVFLNCGMGGLDGFEAARRIRHFDKNVVIVMTSADEKSFSRRKMEELGGKEFLLKPIPPAKIESIICLYTKTRQGLQQQNTIAPRKKKNLRYYPNQIMSKEITRALIYIDNNFSSDISLAEVAELVSLSSYYFSRLFKKEVGLNFSDFLRHKRVADAKRMLEGTELSILDIAAAVGYQEQSYFSKVFRKATGQTPRQYRREAEKARDDRRRVVNSYL